jgi:hypothetical protein
LIVLIAVGAVGAVGAVASQGAAAQAVAPAGVVNRPAAEDTTPRFTNGNSFLIRSLTGTLGFFGGAAVGLGLGLATESRCRCDGDSALSAVAGIALGGAFGVAFGASAPKLRGQCSFGARMLRSTAGSIVGGVLGTAISFNVPPTDADYVLVGMPLGAVLGASTALIGC